MHKAKISVHGILILRRKNRNNLAFVGSVCTLLNCATQIKFFASKIFCSRCCFNCEFFSCSSWNFRFCVKWNLISFHIEVVFTWLFLVARQTRWNAIAWKWSNFMLLLYNVPSCSQKYDHRNTKSHVWIARAECYMMPDATILRANSYTKI